MTRSTKHNSIIAAAVLAVALVISWLIPDYELTPFEAEIMSLLDAERTAAQLEPIPHYSKLSKTARLYAKALEINGTRIKPEDPEAIHYANGKDPSHRLGPDHGRVAESIVQRATSAEEVVEAIMSSPIHFETEMDRWGWRGVGTSEDGETVVVMYCEYADWGGLW